MANIFRKKDAYIDRVNRSTFDLSFVNNLTMKFGAITPVCLLPASFGDSFQINARFNLQLLPTVFPIQTQLYVRLHFVYVRTRTLWEDWMSFFGGDETVTPPWMDVLADGGTPERKNQFNIPDDLQTGSLADYLGVPTTITGTFGQSVFQLPDTPIIRQQTVNALTKEKGYSLPYHTITYSTWDELGDKYRTLAFSDLFQKSSASLVGNPTPELYALVFKYQGVTSTSSPQFIFRQSDLPSPLLEAISRGDVRLFTYGDPSMSGNSCVMSTLPNPDSSGLIKVSPTFSVATSTFFVALVIASRSDNSGVFIQASNDASPVSSNKVVLSPDVLPYFKSITLEGSFSSGEWTKPESANCPFYASSGLPAIPLSALPFRAYEAYYNAFGRDIRNNPFIVDGKPEYNRYIPTVKGGRDSYKYQLHYANWEPDAYTTALQSPQSGVAPLVGITSLGEATFRDASGTEYHAQLETAEDGDTVTGFQMKSSNAPADVVRNLIGMATSGISISDFRNVNSLQRFLEIRVRQSPRYKNLVKGLFDVNLDYDELMMPEFLGGISDTIPVYKVTQTTPTEGNPLGSFAGQGSLQSGMRHVIRKYCPEEGYILGVMSVVPAANYSQLLPPHFTRMNLLDWHFPQFNNISYQPMLYKHLCPYQAFSVNPGNINNVFGYQRAYWDLISSFDEVHGEFRGSMRNFLINRVFDQAPELSKDFLLVNPDHVNDVFAMTSENGDKILGSIAFDITKKTTIPRNSIPHIE